MSDKAWKAYERRVSRDHGCERQPVTGERGAGDSTPHPLFELQMKLRKAIPKCIREWSDSICETATKSGKVGVVIVKEPRKRDEDALVIVRYRDWLDLHGHTRPNGATETE